MRSVLGFWRALVVGDVLVSSAGCTEPVERRQTHVNVVIDADRVVRTNTVRVEAEVEIEATPGGGWVNAGRTVFRPAPDEIKWPAEFKVKVPPEGPVPSYSLVAVAFDRQDAVVARAQAIRDGKKALEDGLKVHFESRCFRQAKLCSDGETCSDGACVNARNDLPLEPTDDAVGMATNGNTAAPGGSEPDSNMATEGEACSGDARACPSHAAQRTLRCDGGVWRTDATCADDERCDTADGDSRGTCQPVARECMNQKPNVAFCAEERMLVCADLVSAEVRPCAENQQCVPGATEATCGCRPGFVKDGLACREAAGSGSGCGDDNGGCDKLTTCSLSGGQRTCSPCPAGYSGSGMEGCAPLLQTLVARGASITPAIAPGVFEYRVHAPLVTPVVSLTAAGPGATHVAVDSVELQRDQPWVSPLLTFGEIQVELKLTSEAGVSNTYAIIIERSGEEAAFVKASNTGQDDLFATSLSVSGDTLAAGAPAEDSSAGGVNANQSSNAATDSGAVYMYRRGARGWMQEAYLKVNAPEAGEQFGGNLSLDGDTLAVGAIHATYNEKYNPDSRAGAAYVFTRSNGVWSQRQKLVPSQSAPGDLFGLALALQGDTLAVGAMGAAAPSGERTGVIYVFERSGDTWVERQILSPSQPAGVAGIGSSVVLSGERLLAGAPYGTPGRKGAAFVFVRKDGMWVEEQMLEVDGLADDSTFGFSIATHGDRIVVGAPHWPYNGDGLTSTPAGEAYVFEKTGGRWQQTAMLRAPSPSNTDIFGGSIVMSESAIIIAADREGGSSRGINGGDPARKGTVSSGAVFVYANVGKKWELSDYVKASNAGAADGFGWTMSLSGETLLVAAPYESSDATGVGSGGGGLALRSGALYVFR